MVQVFSLQIDLCPSEQVGQILAVVHRCGSSLKIPTDPPQLVDELGRLCDGIVAFRILVEGFVQLRILQIVAAVSSKITVPSGIFFHIVVVVSVFVHMLPFSLSFSSDAIEPLLHKLREFGDGKGVCVPIYIIAGHEVIDTKHVSLSQIVPALGGKPVTVARILDASQVLDQDEGAVIALDLKIWCLIHCSPHIVLQLDQRLGIPRL